MHYYSKYHDEADLAEGPDEYDYERYIREQQVAAIPAQIVFTDAWGDAPLTAEQLAALEAEEVERAAWRGPLPGRGAFGECIDHHAKHHVMDFIPDKTLYRAVMFARWLIRDNRQPSFRACLIAARRYMVRPEDVRYYVGQVGGRISAWRRQDAANRRD